MRLVILVIAGFALAACDSMPAMPTVFGGAGPAAPLEPESPRQAAFVALVETNGCRVDPRDHAFVHEAGFTDLEIGDFGKRLTAEGRAEVTTDGGLVVQTESCL